MSVSTSTPPLSLTSDELATWKQDGFVILRSLFSAAEVHALAAETDRLLTTRRDLISPRNLRCRYMPHADTGEQLFEVFDPVNDISAVCESFTSDPRIVQRIESIYGGPAALFKEKLIFKLPGAMGYNLHQDIPLYWKGFPRSFLTVLIPIDATRAENGCTEVYRGYHHGFLTQSTNPQDYMLSLDLVDASRKVELSLEPGDVAIFHGLTPHRSEPNRSTGMRRVFYVSYNAFADGGDQRAAHYAQFQEKMRTRLNAAGGEPAYFL